MMIPVYFSGSDFHYACYVMDKQIKRISRPFETTPGLVMQSQRLMQILWISTTAIFISLIFMLLSDAGWTMITRMMTVTLCVFMLCLWLNYQQRAQSAAGLFTMTLTILACFLIYNSGGLHDEGVLIFPAILLLASVFGTRRQFIVLLLGLISFLAYIVTAHIQGWHKVPDQVETNLGSFINVAVIIIANGFFAVVLASDLRKALTELNLSKRELLELNDQLEIRVNQRTEQVETAHKALQESMDKLEQAMTELVYAEKLAALGSMVAGISHELNTPIGNTLLAATSMEKLFEEVSEKIQAGNFRRTSFDEFIKEGLEMSSLISRSTQRAADMVVSFKQVAIDQTSEQRRTFDLRDVIEDNAKALLTNFKKKKIRLINSVPAGIECNSFPGPLGQILSNIIQNAILHGFDEKSSGTLTIEADSQMKQVLLSIRDDGVGMSSSVLTHVFDPFFTTRLGRGGSGLGLSISHRIATSVLGGDLRAESTLGHGATFILTLPKVAPFPI